MESPWKIHARSDKIGIQSGPGYYHNSRGGAVDPHCGWAFNLAAPDYVRPCLTDLSCTMPKFNSRKEVCEADLASIQS